mmetsp:Transcript_46455/g.53542  ORF Transcript_46455/g.53542 Transcript_46455/m.53542 type:complete len:252 (+) Transcript_46455:122-877(+)
MECPTCFEEYNREERMPKVLRECGHTFCRTCLKQLRDGDSVRCPTCRRMNVHASEEVLLSNHLLLKFIALKEINQKKQEAERVHYQRLMNSVNGEVEKDANHMRVIEREILNDHYSKLSYPELFQIKPHFYVKSLTASTGFDFTPSSLLLPIRNLWYPNTGVLRLFKKSRHCSHSYSCLENLIRTSLRWTTFTLTGVVFMRTFLPKLETKTSIIFSAGAAFVEFVYNAFKCLHNQRKQTAIVGRINQEASF